MSTVGMLEMEAVAALLALGCNSADSHSYERQQNGQSQSAFETDKKGAATAALSLRSINLSLDVTRVTSTSTPTCSSPSPSSPTFIKLASGGYIIRSNHNGQSPNSPTFKNVNPSDKKRPDLHKQHQAEQRRWSTQPLTTHSPKKTCDKATQTDGEYQLPQVEKMEAFIKELCNRINILESQLEEAHSSVDKSVEKGSDENGQANDESGQARRKYVRRAKTYSFSTYKTMPSEGDESDGDTEFKLEADENADDMEISDEEYSLSDEQVYNSKFVRKTDANTPGNMVPIGDGHASVPSRLLKQLDWTSYTNATRKLLTAVFSRRILATHSLTGKQSPAFPGKPAKKQLDPALVNDIVQTVSDRCKVPENIVRTSITTKCADESKMLRSRLQNKNKRRLSKKENEAPGASTSEGSTYSA